MCVRKSRRWRRGRGVRTGAGGGCGRARGQLRGSREQSGLAASAHLVGGRRDERRGWAAPLGGEHALLAPACCLPSLSPSPTLALACTLALLTESTRLTRAGDPRLAPRCAHVAGHTRLVTRWTWSSRLVPARAKSVDSSLHRPCRVLRVLRGHETVLRVSCTVSVPLSSARAFVSPRARAQVRVASCGLRMPQGDLARRVHRG